MIHTGVGDPLPLALTDCCPYVTIIGSDVNKIFLHEAVPKAVQSAVIGQIALLPEDELSASRIDGNGKHVVYPSRPSPGDPLPNNGAKHRFHFFILLHSESFFKKQLPFSFFYRKIE